MNSLIGFLIIFILIALLSIIRPITVLIHELGHALPSLLLTKNRVTIYIGSYGDPDNSLIIKIGRLKIFFKYNLLLWNVGLCTHEDYSISIWKEALIIMFGPILSLVSGIVICYYLFTHSNDEKLMFLGFVFLASSLLDFYISIFRGGYGTKLFNGRLVYSDGQQLIQLFKLKIFPTEFKKASVFYDQKNYNKSSELYLKILDSGIVNHHVFQLTIVSLILSKQYEAAKKKYYKFKDDYTLDSNDYSNLGVIYSKLGDGIKSMEMYNKSLELNPNNFQTLNNRGFQFNINREFRKAILDFDRVIETDQYFAYALNNRGHSKIELGLVEEGLIDIQKSISIDPENPYAYRNLGIYYMNKQNNEKAIELFNKAYSLDSDTYLIDELIAKVNHK